MRTSLRLSTHRWRLRDRATLAADYLDVIDGIVGFAARGLLVSTTVD